LAAFSAAAFRFGHSLLPNVIERWSKAHGFIGINHDIFIFLTRYIV